MKTKILFALTVVACSTIGWAQIQYKVRDVGPFHAQFINASGATAGNGPSYTAFEWDRHYGLTQLPGYSYAHVEAWAMSDNGSVVGWAWDSINRVIPIIWDHQHGFRNALWRFKYQGQVHGINASGRMCGIYWPNGTINDSAAFVAEADGSWRALPPLDGLAWADAWCINDAGVVAGYSGDGVSGSYPAVLWDQAGVPHDVGNLPGQTQIWIHDLNNAGWICGDTFGDNGSPGYLRDPQGDFTPLLDPFLPGGQMGAGGLNDHNDCVGFATVAHLDSVGFVRFARDGIIRDLNTMLAPGNEGVNIDFAYDINNRGQICAWGTLNGEPNHGFILTPTPPKPVWRGGWLFK